ncbi:MAG: cation:dicarboxylase symporter family transporter [Chlamydiota bacterium]
MRRTGRIFAGLGAGILCGLFFGDLCRVLEPAGVAFVKLMQMAVIPYVVVSVVAGIGGLDRGEARTVARKGGLLMLGLWLIGIVLFFSMQFAFPPRVTASFYSASEVAKPEQIDLIATFIPSNPFKALSDGMLPAIVLFSIFLGAALIGARGNKPLIEILHIVSAALSRIMVFVMAVVPYGIFIVSAYAVGTLSPDTLFKLQFFCESYIALSVILALVALPLLVSIHTGFRYRDILAASSGALVLAFSAQNVFISLPLIERGVRDLFGKNGDGDGKAGTYVEVLLPIAYNFPRWGDFAPYLFILFTGWLYEVPLGPGRQFQCAAAGIFSFFGSGKSAVPFLLTLMRLPEDAFQLYLASSPFNSYFGAGLSCMFLFAFTAVCAARLTGRFRIRAGKFMLGAAVLAVVMAACIGGLRAGFARMLRDSYRGDERLAEMEMPAMPRASGGGDRVAVTVYRSIDEFFAANPNRGDHYPDVFDRIMRRGAIRVGYNEDALPFAFFNAKGALVGYDVQMARELAALIGVPRVEFVPVTYDALDTALNEGCCDIVMAGVVITPERLRKMKFSSSYMSSHLAFVVPDYRKDEFTSLEKIMQMDGLSIAVMKGTAYEEIMPQLFPHARAVRLDSEKEFFAENKGDALLTTAEEGAPWTLLYPAYCVASLGPNEGTKFLNAYAVAKNSDDSLLRFMNALLDMERAQGALDKKYDYWVLGKNPLRARRRWSVIRDVLHWVS